MEFWLGVVVWLQVTALACSELRYRHIREEFDEMKMGASRLRKMLERGEDDLK